MKPFIQRLLLTSFWIFAVLSQQAYGQSGEASKDRNRSITNQNTSGGTLPKKDGVYLQVMGKWLQLPAAAGTEMKRDQAEVNQELKTSTNGIALAGASFIRCGDVVPFVTAERVVLGVKGSLQNIDGLYRSKHRKITVFSIEKVAPATWGYKRYFDSINDKISYGDQRVENKILSPGKDQYLVTFPEDLKPGFYAVNAGLDLYVFEVRSNAGH